MKALILVGGYGTRLRPLTLSVPKPLVEFANIPMVEHQIAALEAVGVVQVILAVGYDNERMREAVKVFNQKYKLDVVISRETTPLGTAGPIKLAEEHLSDCQDFLVLNADIICKYPFPELIAFHKAKGCEGTIVLTEVEDPSRFGVVVMDPEHPHRVQRFVEKPKEYISNKINAGIYILSSKVIKRIEAKPTSIEREIFPQMVEDNALAGFILQSFWMDIGKPQDYLRALKLYLSSLETAPAPESQGVLLEGPNVVGKVFAHKEAKVDPSAVVGPDVTISRGCVIEAGARVKESAVMEGSRVGAHSFVSGSIIGWGCGLGRWVRVDGLSVLALDVRVKDEVRLEQTLVLPHKVIEASVEQPGTILM